MSTIVPGRSRTSPKISTETPRRAATVHAPRRSKYLTDDQPPVAPPRIPRGRRAEDGPIDQRYPLSETPWDGYPQRTAWNVRDSDGTLILTRGRPDRGTALTERLARRRNKPCLVVDLAVELGVAERAAADGGQGLEQAPVGVVEGLVAAAAGRHFSPSRKHQLSRSGASMPQMRMR